MDLKGKKIKELKSLLEEKKLSETELSGEYKKVIASKNKDINAFLEVFETPISSRKESSLISGIPTALKDNFNMIDTKTTASSNILKDYISPYNATVTERLLEEGAVILGKTNLDAFAHGSSTETSDFGVTKNPHDLSRVAGGSSGGSAAAVAAGMLPYSIGSETAGSVRGPAAWCGIYGFAPTFGRISRYGVVAMGSSLDRPGVLANSIEDLAIITDVIAGHDPLDATSLSDIKTTYYEDLDSKKIEDKKLTLGIPKCFLDERIEKSVRSKLEETISKLSSLGFKILELDLLDPKYSIAVYTIICRSEVSSNLARIDGIRYGHYSEEYYENILDQIAANRGEGFGYEAKQRSLTGAFALSSGFIDAYYKKAARVRRLIINDFNKAFEKVDLIIGPTMPTVAPKIGVTKNNPLFGELADMLTEPSALAGLPCSSVPIGYDSENLPIGMQIIGDKFMEQKVLDFSLYLEKNNISINL